MCLFLCSGWSNRVQGLLRHDRLQLMLDGEDGGVHSAAELSAQTLLAVRGPCVLRQHKLQGPMLHEHSRGGPKQAAWTKGVPGLPCMADPCSQARTHLKKNMQVQGS